MKAKPSERRAPNVENFLADWSEKEGPKLVKQLAKQFRRGRKPKFEFRRDEAEFRLDPAEAPSSDEAINHVPKMFGIWASIPDDPAQLRAAAEAYLTKLAQLSRAGNGKALWHFAQLANDIGEGLSHMTHENPAAMRPIARQCARWPMMRSTHPLTCDSDKWLDEIQLGKSVPIYCDQISKWKPDQAAEVATRLFEYVSELRRMNPVVILAGKERKRVKDWLPEFNRDSAPQWWTVAWSEFTASYPEPENVPFFNGLVTAPSKRKSPGRIRQAIQEKIRARFIAFAF